MHNQINTECLLHILLEIKYFIFVHHVLPILYIYFLGARFGCRAYARGLDYLGRTRRSSSGLSHHLADGLHHQPSSRSVRHSLTLPPTSWLDCSVFAGQSFRPVAWVSSSASLEARQLSWGLLGIRLLCTRVSS
jgi:hypothetical protein